MLQQMAWGSVTFIDLLIYLGYPQVQSRLSCTSNIASNRGDGDIRIKFAHSNLIAVSNPNFEPITIYELYASYYSHQMDPTQAGFQPSPTLSSAKIKLTNTQNQVKR